MDNNKTIAKVFIGLLFIAAGIVWACATLNPDLFEGFDFTGWWTLFIIIPSLVGLFSDNQKAGPILGLGIGIILLCAARGYIEGAQIGRLFLSLMMVVIGVACIFGKAAVKKAHKEEIRSIQRDGRNIRQITATFGKQMLSFEGEVFEGADVKCSFGAVRLDLRKAIIDGKVLIHTDCSFGGMEIVVPEGMAVKVAANASFGGIEDKRKIQPVEGDNVIYIDGNVSFGGIEIK